METKDIPSALEAYSKNRYDNMVIMCRLSIDNYEEMRSKVVSKWFNLQTFVERRYARIFPNSFIPVRTMVVHDKMDLTEAVERDRRQKLIINSTIGFLWFHWIY